jgi:PAS domain S-box-containing protein
MPDWTSIASALAERHPKPVVVVDGRGRVQLLNSAMENLLGWPRYEAVGLALARIGLGTQGKAWARRWLADVLRGSIHECDLEAVNRAGEHLKLAVEVALVGAGGGVNGMLVVRSAEPQAGDLRGPNKWVELDVSRERHNAGTILAVRSSGSGLVGAIGRRCFEVLHGRTEACSRCPALDDPSVPWPRTLVVRERDEQGFYVVTAEALGEAQARLTRVHLPDATLRQVVTWRVNELAELHELTARERSVVGEVVLGRSSDDIGKTLSIAKRTVKFHQANALAKLGLRTRAELMELVLGNGPPAPQGS